MIEQFRNYDLHPLSEKIVDILSERTQTADRDFFRVLTAYHLSKVPSMMQAVVASPDRGNIPINFYGVNLAPSGHGKGHSTNIFEDLILSEFTSKFTKILMPQQAGLHIDRLAVARDIDGNIDAARSKVQIEYENAGIYQPVFDSATAPAIKQLRHKILMANIGALNLEIDEIGSNIIANAEALAVYLELYDVGKVKEKLIKHTTESKRFTPIKGVTPTNLMMFGTPTRLLNAAKEEDEFYAFLETGYARRCFFSYARTSAKQLHSDPEKVYDALTGKANNSYLNTLKQALGNLATHDFAHKKIKMDKTVAVHLIRYKLACEHEAEKFSEYDELRKAEMTHRYFKVMKLAGTYAFIEGCDEITEGHLNNAIALAEISGVAFDSLQRREKNYVKLAKFLRDKDDAVTRSDLQEELPFFKGPENQKNEMIKLAASFGYQNNIVLKTQYRNGIEFLSANSLKRTDLDNIIISSSKGIAQCFVPDTKPFDSLVALGKNDKFHWCNHHFEDGHRQEENAIKGFNLLVFDVEDSVSLDMAKMLLKGYKAIFYTTKRHDPAKGKERFRVLIPTNYMLEMDKDTYKEFMKNLYTWLPFDADTQVGQRAKKFLCHNGQVEVLDGELFDVLPFIPQTQMNKDRKVNTITEGGLVGLERWFVNNTAEGNRSNQLHNYAMALVDAGKDITEITQRISDVNEKLPEPLGAGEMQSTILQTAARKLKAKGN